MQVICLYIPELDACGTIYRKYIIEKEFRGNEALRSHGNIQTQASMGESCHAPSKSFITPQGPIMPSNPVRNASPCLFIYPWMARSKGPSFAQSTRHKIQLAHTPGRHVPTRPDTTRTLGWEIVRVLVWI